MPLLLSSIWLSSSPAVLFSTVRFLCVVERLLLQLVASDQASPLDCVEICFVFSVVHCTLLTGIDMVQALPYMISGEHPSCNA